FADLNEISVPSEHLLRRVFDLTNVEARLAQRVARGDGLEEVAARLGIKISTARSQLASIFAKTKTRRQAKLVAVLGRLAQLGAGAPPAAAVRIADAADRFLAGGQSPAGDNKACIPLHRADEPAALAALTSLERAKLAAQAVKI